MSTPFPSDMTGAYALDAVDEFERRRLGDLLEADDEAGAEVAGFRETVARLTIASARKAPDDLRRRVLDEVARTPQVRHPAAERARQAKRFGGRRVAVVAGGLAAAAAVAALIVLRPGASTSISAVERAGDAEVVRLEAAGSSGRVTSSADEGAAVVALQGLPEIAADRDVQLWLIRGGQPTSVAVLDGESVEGGAVTKLLPDQLDLRPGDQLGVTIEPNGGSPQPTTPVLLAGKVG